VIDSWVSFAQTQAAFKIYSMSGKLIRCGLILAFASALFTQDLLGASRSSGPSSSRSSSSSSGSWGRGSSSSSSSPSKSFSWGSSTPKAPPAIGPNVKRDVSAPQKSAVDVAAQRKAISTGTAYKSKAQAIASFKSQNANKYPTKYAVEPTIRPSHIPRTTIVGGSTHVVVYNRGFGGYGYFIGPIWYPYYPLADAAMLGVLMANSGHAYSYPVGNTTVYRSDIDGWCVLWTIIGIFGVAAAAVLIVQRLD
jgi:hypothetical protein